jgi:hypothetical protein
MTRHGADTVTDDYEEDEDCYFLIVCSKPSEKEIRQDERDKVLDETRKEREKILRHIENLIVLYGTSGSGYYIDRYITEELHKGGE